MKRKMRSVVVQDSTSAKTRWMYWDIILQLMRMAMRGDTALCKVLARWTRIVIRLRVASCI